VGNSAETGRAKTANKKNKSVLIVLEK
jgi:hypothetical protein